MDAIQQHMIDSYRAAQHGEAPPPLPGRHDWEVVRQARDARRFEAVVEGRPAYRRWRAALRERLTRRLPGTVGRSGSPARRVGPGTSGPSGV
ncbi:hypothetical protein AB0N06_06405 [Streptomyces sp. NPDC051020]|uniref:hypothetical protein n=1 Tax=Streptomyces sp. NPDC051020 TaxID=3155409 RepID=UPI003425D2E1